MRITPRDLLVFEALQRHGPLSSLYLYELTKDLKKNSIKFRHRLRELTDAGYLLRPEEVNRPDVWNDFLIYVLTDKSKEALRAADKIHRYARPVGGGYPHMIMAAALSASAELFCREKGFRFIDQEEILSEAPRETQLAIKPLAIPSSIVRETVRKDKSIKREASDRPTEPDQLFGFEYPTGRRYFALEADRGTESERRFDLADNSIERKLLCYRDILNKATFKKHLGITKAYPMLVTIGPGRVEEMRKLALEVTPEYTDLFLFNCVPGFEIYQRTPPLFTHLFSQGWKRAGKPDLLISQA